MSKSIVVDAHQHFWDPSSHDYPWMTDEMAAIRRPFGPNDLRPLLQEAGVDSTVLVQTYASLQETAEFLELAGRTDFIAGVVGWIDLSSPHVVESIRELQASRNGKHLVGIRHHVYDEPDPRWLLRDDVLRGLEAVGQAGLSYDLNVRTRELPAAYEAALRLPATRFVIDHIAKPPIKAGALDPWDRALAAFSDLGNVFCKLSGMVTEANWTAWTPDNLVPYVERVVGWFGTDRLMFGSDWPVCLLAASYQQVVDACQYALGSLSTEARRKVMGENAIRFYQPDQMESLSREG